MRWILGKTKLFNAKCGKTGKNSVIIRSTSFIIISKTKSSKCFFTSLTALFLISNFRIKSLAKSIPKIVLFMFLCYSTVSLLKHFLTSSSNPVILSDPSLTLAIWSFFSSSSRNRMNFQISWTCCCCWKTEMFWSCLPMVVRALTAEIILGTGVLWSLLWARLGLVAQNSITLLYYSSTIQEIRPEECLPIYRQKKLLQDNCSCCCAEHNRQKMEKWCHK